MTDPRPQVPMLRSALALLALTALACGGRPDLVDPDTLPVDVPGLTLRARMPETEDGTTGVALSPDGRHAILLGFSEDSVLARTDGTVVRALPGRLSACAWAPDSTAFACRSGQTVLYASVDPSGPRWTAACDRCRDLIDLSPDGATVAVVDDTTLYLHEAATGRLISTVGLLFSTLSNDALAFTADGAALRLGGGILEPPSEIDLFTGEARVVEPGFQLEHLSPSAGAGFRAPIAAGPEGHVRFLMHRVGGGAPPVPFDFCGVLHDGAVAPDDRTIAVGGDNGAVYFVDLETGAEKGRLEGYPCGSFPPPMAYVGWSDDGGTFALVRNDTASFYDVAAPLLAAPPEPAGCAGPCPVPPDTARDPILYLKGPTVLDAIGEIRAIATSVYSNSTLAIGTSQGVEIWNADFGVRLARLPVPGGVDAVGWGEEGERLVLGTTDGRLLVTDRWSGATQRELHVGSGILAVGFRGDDVLFATAAGASVWPMGADAPTSLQPTEAPTRDAAFTDDGGITAVAAGDVVTIAHGGGRHLDGAGAGLGWRRTTVAIGVSGRKLRLWDAASEDPGVSISGLPGEVTALSWRRDTPRLAVLVDAPGGAQGHVFGGETLDLRSSFSPGCVGGCRDLQFGGTKIYVADADVVRIFPDAP